MSIDIQQFRDLSDANRVLIDSHQQTVQTKGSWTLGKVVTWVKDLAAGADTPRAQANQEARAALFDALNRSEGQSASQRAMSQVLGATWATATHSLSGRDVQQVLDTARQIRMDTMAQNQVAAARYGNANASPANMVAAAVSEAFGERHDTSIRLQGTELGNRLEAARHAQGYPSSSSHDKQVFERFMGLVTKDPGFARESLPAKTLQDLADRAITQHYGQVQANFDQEYPGLARFSEGSAMSLGFRSPSLLNRLEGAINENRTGLLEEEVQPALRAIELLKASSSKLGEISFDHAKAVQSLSQIQTLSAEVTAVRDVLDQLADAAIDAEGGFVDQPPDALLLLDCLADDLQAMSDRLQSKREMLEQLIDKHPFSEKNVAYTRRMLAETALSAASTHLLNQSLALEEQRDAHLVGSPRYQELSTALGTLYDKTTRIQNMLNQHIQAAEHAYQNAQSTAVIPKEHIAESPLFRSEKSERAFVNQLLAAEGLDKIDKHGFEEARDVVLNTRQDWSTIERTLVTQHQRTTQTASSTIASAINLHGSYTQHQLNGQDLQGVSAHTQTQAAPAIPKNLQHSTLVVDGQTRVDMIRHGIIANAQQAESVISTAIWSDPALREQILGKFDNDAVPTIDYAFSNVNLESPWAKPIGKFLGDRRGMQDDHIAAFKALANAPQPVGIPFLDRNGEQRTVQVNLRVSVLAIPVNNAVGTLGTLGRVWSHVEQTNREGLQSLVGDLGDPSRGVEGSARGTPVGGMLGDITREMDRLIRDLPSLPNSPANHEKLAQLTALRGNLQEAVDIVRDVYCSGNYQTNDGNRYKFALAIMFANNLAKQAHSVMGLGETGNGFGSSQGCMSNKDRGGNADGLLKSLNLSADNAFKLLRYNTQLSPNEMVAMLDALPPREAKDLLIMGLVYSGQLEAQQLQTLVMGSKNAGDLMQAIKDDPEAYPLLKGLSSYAKA